MAMTDESQYAREGFDPSCSVRTDFAGLREGDWIDYWVQPRPVVEHIAHDDGRVTIYVRNEGGGQDVALSPGDQPVWRRRRPTEPAPESRTMAHRRAYPWSLCADCKTPVTCEELQDLDRCP